MPFDWFTVLAQILNFLVLVWILKRFLYRPVLRSIEERQVGVKKTLEDAAALQEKANTELAKWETERRDLARHREETLSKAVDEAAQEKARLLEQARSEYEAARQRWQASLDRERAEFEKSITEQAEQEVLQIAGQMLRDLSDENLQARIVKKFLSLLANEKATPRLPMEESAGSHPIVRSAFELDASHRKEISEAVHSWLGADDQIEFEVKPSLSCGIEVAIDGHKVAWSIDDYLRSLGAWVREATGKSEPKDSST